MAGGGKTATTTAQTQIPPEVLSRYNTVNARAEQTAQTPFQPYSSNPSDFVAGLNPTQQQATQGLANMGQTVANTNQMASPYFDAANYYIGMGTMSSAPKDLDINKYMSPYLQNVANPTMDLMRQEQEAQMSGQTGNAIKQGAFGGDRAGIASAVLARQNDMAKAKTYGDIMQQGYTQALGAAQQQQGVDLSARQADAARFAQAGQSMMGLGQGIGGLNLQQGQAGLGQLQALLGAGTLGQQTDQAGKTALYNQFLQERGYPFQISQFLANIAMGTGALSGQTTQTTQPAPFFSDRRLKENDEVIGKTFDGLPIHRYNYKGDKRTQIGLMADEVERKKPEAVGLAAGYKTVDYDRATRATGGGVVDELLARQQASFGPFAQAGLYGGKSSYVPAAALPVQRLQIQAGNVTAPKSGLSEIMDAAKMATSAYEMGDKGYETGKKAYTKVSSLFGNDKEDDKGKFYAAGGGVSGLGGAMPYAGASGYFPEEILEEQEKKKLELPKPGSTPEKQKSGMSQLMKTAAPFAAMIPGAGPFISAGLSAGSALFAKGGAVDIDPEEAAIRTIAAEIGGKSPEEARGVAAVINNRLNSGKYGNNYRDVVLAKNQFEPWNDPNGANYPLKFNQDHPRMGLAREAFQAVKSGGEDPTGGATHFYAPVAQKALGRDDPSWAAGRETMDIGPTRFVKGVDGAPARPITSGLGAVGDTASRAVSGLGEAAKAILPAKEDGSTDWKKILIPVATGLGAMASSNSRYLGSAMLQGLGAGAQAYAGLEKQQAGIRQTEAETQARGLENQGTVISNYAKSLVQTPSGNFVVLKDGRFMPMADYITLSQTGRAPPVMGSVPDDIRKKIEDYQKVSGSIVGVPPKPPVAIPTAPEAPKVPGAPDAPTVQPPGKVESAPLPEAPSAPAPAVPEAPLAQPGVGFDKQSLGSAKKEQDVAYNGGPAYANAQAISQQYRETVPKEANGARASGKYMVELVSNLSDAAKGKGLDTPGYGFEGRSVLTNMINTMARATGLPEIGSGDSIAQISQKLETMQSAMQAAGAGQTSLGALETLKKAVANPNMTPRAFGTLAADMMTQNQRAIDQDNHREAYGQRSGGLFANAGQDFERTNPREKYKAEAQAIQDVVLNAPDVLKAITDGKTYKAKDIDAAFEKKYGLKGMSRYFTGGR